jgi:protein phosphatase
MTIASTPHIDFAGNSEAGPVREENQDSIRLPDQDCLPERGLLYGLADGMGGLANGKMASSMALDTLFEAFYRTRSPIPKSMGQGIEQANLKVYNAAQGLGPARMGTTLTAVNVLDQNLCVAHVGDSRAYLLRDGKARLLTNDHTAVGELVRMKLVSPDKVRTHAQRSILNRAVGLGLFVRPDITSQRLEGEDRIILCSDGLWSALEDEEIGAIASSDASVDELCANLVAAALDRGSDDNVSTIVIRVHSVLPRANAEKKRRTGIFSGFLTQADPVQTGLSRGFH